MNRYAYLLDGIPFHRQAMERLIARASLSPDGVCVGDHEPGHLARLLRCWREGLPCLPRPSGEPDARTRAFASLACLAQPGDAYLLGTSGTTGEPKCVAVTRENVRHFSRWLCARPMMDEVQTVFCPSPFSFDLSLAPLVLMERGACLATVSVGMTADLARLFRAMSDSSPDLLVSTPTFVDCCLCDPDFSRALLPALRGVWLCGETVRPATLRRLWERFPALRVFNAYGPTEATCAVCQCELTPDTPAPYPAGELHSTASGIDLCGGEILLSGGSVARGYLTQAGVQTFDGRFATGDRGELRDGLLFPLGRADRQIKLGGVRTEPGELERALLSLPGVTHAYAEPVCVNGRAVRLRAQVCGEIDRETALTGLRALLPERLLPRELTIYGRPDMDGNGKWRHDT